MRDKKINSIINSELEKVSQILKEIKLTKNKNFLKLCSMSIKAIKNKKKIIFYGNGGSASDAQHLAAEFVVKYNKERIALPAISLAT